MNYRKNTRIPVLGKNTREGTWRLNVTPNTKRQTPEVNSGTMKKPS